MTIQAQTNGVSGALTLIGTPTKASNVVTKMVVRKSSVPVDSDAVMLVSQGHVLEDADGVWRCVRSV